MTADPIERATLPVFGPPAGLACHCWHARARHDRACLAPRCGCSRYRLSLLSLVLAVRRLFP